jgi:hypothetical protein
MTAIAVTASLPWTHRAAVRLGRALTAWGTRPIARASLHTDRVARLEGIRDHAAHTLPQLPR